MFYIFFSSKKIYKGLSLFALAFIFNCLVLLNSRGAFLALIVSYMYMLGRLMREEIGTRMKIQLLVGGMIGIWLFFYISDILFWERMSTLNTMNLEAGSKNRLNLWLKTFEILKDYPLGAGAKGYDFLSSKYLPAEWLSGNVRSVHSTWFEVLSEFGYQGLFAFTGYIFSNFILLRKVKMFLYKKNDVYHVAQATAIEASFISLLVAGSFLNFFYGELMHWFPMYIAAFANIYMIKAAKEKEIENKSKSM